MLGINAFQFAADPTTALREAARVLAPGGRLVASLFADRKRVESTVIHEALAHVGGQTDAATPHAPYLLSEPGALETAMAEAGLAVVSSGEVTCVWEYRRHRDPRPGQPVVRRWGPGAVGGAARGGRCGHQDTQPSPSWARTGECG